MVTDGATTLQEYDVNFVSALSPALGRDADTVCAICAEVFGSQRFGAAEKSKTRIHKKLTFQSLHIPCNLL